MLCGRNKGKDMSERKTILIVEDEPDEVAYLSALFADHGFAVISKGSLMIHETIAWFEECRSGLPRFGFEYTHRYVLPRHCWWTDYGAPLEERIRAFREAHGGGAASGELARYEREVASLKEAPGGFDSGFFPVRRRG
jgi:hypothetical protein